MYTLIGNADDNNFECKEDKKCVMHGYLGDDSFKTARKHTDFTLKDFKDFNEADKLIINRPKSLTSTMYGENKSLLIITYKKDKIVITFYNINKSTVVGWVDVAIEDKNLRPSKKRKNPIYIK